MSAKYVIDTSVWMEYFGATQKGLSVKKIVEQEQIAISIIGIAELAYAYEIENKEFINILNFIEERAKILPLSVNIAINAAKLKNKIRKTNSKFGLADSIHLASAEDQKAILLTCDYDFSGAENVMII